MTDLGISGIGDAELIASGGSALVYAADNAAGERVAVKVLRGFRGAEVARRFAREQQAAERLQEHPNIIDVHRSGVSDAGEPFLIMPLMSRGSLADELDSGVFPLSQAVDDVLAAADAIDFAHRRGVLHRDLKPGNLLRTDDGGIVVTDFGIAKVVDAGITSATVGATTPLFAAPELLSDNEASMQSDVYSLGAMLYALLAGAPAFSDSPNIWATIARIREEEPAPIALVPGPVMRTIRQAMAKDPADRPPTAQQFSMNLHAARDAGDSWAPPLPAQVTVPAPPPGPAMVPAVSVESPSNAAAEAPRPPISSVPVPAESRTSRPSSGPAISPPDVPGPPMAPHRRSTGAMALAAIAAVVVLGGLAWFGVNSLFGDSGDDGDDTVAEPIDTSLPAPTSVADSTDAGDDDDPDEAASEGHDTSEPTDTDASGDAEPTPTDRLVSFTGSHFSAYFPEGWSVARSDVDVGYGFRSQFRGPDDMYLNVDTTPAEQRTGSQTIAQSAREIAASISSASAVTTEEIDGLEIHSFTFRNNRGIESIDIFFEVDGDGYAIVAGSNAQTDAVFDIARQVASTVRSAP